MYERILTPVDGSQPSDVAADHAIALTRDADATLPVVSVVDVKALSAARLDTEALRDGYEAERHVAAVAERAHGSGVDVETGVVRGTPYRSILDHVDTVDADLVVMDSRGRRGLERSLLGSTTERVLRPCPIPVLVGRGESRDYQDPDANARTGSLDA